MAEAEPLESARYDAFISYRRTDAAFARVLEKALNAYRPPKGLDVPQRRLKVFRDEGDLTGTDYFLSIDGFLGRSHKLIVLCSPAARQSEYVDDEIRRFVRHRGAEHLVPLLIAGVPNNEATPEQADQRAFPQALVDAVRMPLAVSYLGFDARREKVDRGRFEGSWYTLLANLYDKSRDEIEQRDRARRRRTRNLIGVIVGSVMAGFAGLAALAWVQKLAADEQRNIALRGLSKYLATASEETRLEKPQTGLLLAVEAVRTTRDVDGTVTPAAEDALRSALASASGTPLGGQAGTVTAAAFNIGSTRLATLGPDGRASVWNLLAPGEPPKSAALPPGKHAIAGFSPKGDWLALADTEPAGITLWPVDAAGPAGAKRFDAGAPNSRALAFSADGRWLATSGDDAALRLWPLDQPGAAARLLAGHRVTRDYKGKLQGPIQAAFDPQGRWLFSSAWDKSVRLWDLQDAQGSAQVLAGASNFAAPHFSADGQWLAQAVGSDSDGDAGPRLAVWHLQQGQWESLALGAEAAPGAGNPVSPATGADPVTGFATEATHLVSVIRSQVRLWDLGAAPPSARALPGYQAAMSRDGQLLATAEVDDKAAAAGRHVVRVQPMLATDDGRQSTLAGFDSPVLQLLFSPDARRLAVVTQDGRAWLLAIGGETAARQALRGPESRVEQLRFSADGRWIFATARYGEASIRLWPVDNPSSDPVQYAGVPAGIELAYKSRNGGGGGEPIGGLPDALAIDPRGRWMAVPGEGHTTLLVDLDDPAKAARVLAAGRDHDVTAAVFGPQGDWLATADWNHSLRLWKLAALDQPAVAFEMPRKDLESSVSAIAVSPDGGWIATGGSSGEVALWRVAAPNAAPRLLGGHEGWITSLAFSPDGRQLLSSGEDGRLQLWPLEPADAKPIVIEAHRDAIVDAVFADGGRRIVSAGIDALIKRWSTAEPAQPPLVLRGHAERIAGLSLDPGQRWLASGSLDGTVRLWDLQAALPSPLLLGPRKGQINAVAISADNHWIAAADSAGDIRVWSHADAQAQPALLHTTAPDEPATRGARVWALRFSPDGRWLAALAGGKLRLWRMRIDEQLALACRLAGRNLREADWRAHLGSLPYRLTCADHGLHPDWLTDADTVAKSGEIDRAIALYSTARTLDPALAFEPRQRAVALATRTRLDDGRNLARQGSKDAALAELNMIRQLDPASTLDAAAEVERVVKAKALIDQAAAKAGSGALDAAIALYRQARATDDSIDVDPETQARRGAAPSIQAGGDELARQGRLDEAAAAYAKAIDYGLETGDEPMARARDIRAHQLVAEAGKIGERGDIEAATETFRQALALKPALGIDPVAEGRKSVVGQRIEEADRRAGKNEFDAAAALYREALSYDPKAGVTAERLNETCWRAITQDQARQDQARQVLALCDLAVSLDPKDGRTRDSRGVARALVNDRAGAIEDFAAFVAWATLNDANASEAEARKRWIVKLKQGLKVQSFKQLEAL